MNLNFKYDKNKDIWCLLNKGNSSNNSQKPTKQYTELLEYSNNNLNEIQTFDFIDKYILERNIVISDLLEKYQKDFAEIKNDFKNIAEKIFNVSLPKDINVYLTINSRCPYNIKDNYFFVSVSNENYLGTILHELWHFYTYYKFGKDNKDIIGNEKYNEIKESLTILLNIECSHLFSKDYQDSGYSQHQKMREKILELWNQNKDIDFIWKNLFD